MMSEKRTEYLISQSPPTDTLLCKDAMFSATVDFFSGEDGEVTFYHILRPDGNRVADRIVFDNEISKRLRSNKIESWDRVSFLADLEFKNIRIAEYKPVKEI